MNSPLRVAILVSDEREVTRTYGSERISFGQAPDALLSGFAALKDCEIHVVSCLQSHVRSPRQLASNIFIHSLRVPKIGWLRSGYAGCITAIRRALKDIRPDVVHGQGTERYCGLAASFCGFPSVVTIHGNMRLLSEISRARPFSFLWCHAWLERLALPRVRGVFCNSEHTERLVRAVAKKVWRVPNALNPAFFSTAAAGRKTSPPVLLNVGTVTPLKGQISLLEAAERWHAKGASFKLQFLGKADERSEYARDFLRRLTAPPVATFVSHLGFKSPEQIVSQFDQAHALVHVSQEESFGLVVAEALARNLKVFAFAAGGVVEIAEGAELAELYPIDDWPNLSDAVTRWFKQGCPRPATAFECARRYLPEAVARQHLQIYRELLS